NRQDAWQVLNEVFKQINTEPYPALIVTPEGRAQLDLSRTVVQATVLQAYRDFVRTFLQSRRPALAKSAADTAVNSYNYYKDPEFRQKYFDPLFDPSYLSKFPRPLPADPVFFKPPQVRFELMLPAVQKAFLEES